MSYKELGSGFGAAFSAGWKAFGDGNPPAGAAVADSEGKVIAFASNAVNHAVRGQPVGGHRLAHAALNALLTAAAVLEDGEEYDMYLTEEPCLLCRGAAVTAGIKKLYYAMKEGAALPAADETDNISLIGPDDDTGRVQAVLWCYYLYETDKDARSIERLYPASAALAKSLKELDTLRVFAKNGACAEEVYDFLSDKLKIQTEN